jgi:hypothetical protein
MSEEEFKMPRKFTFDEFYEMLKEFVNDPKARAALATYDVEDAEGRGDLLNGSLCSDLAFNAYADFRAIGWSILVKNGWPPYVEVIKITDYSLRSTIQSTGYQIWKIGQRLIRKEPVQKNFGFQDQGYDINDRASVLRLLKRWAKTYKFEMPYKLTLEEWNNNDGN